MIECTFLANFILLLKRRSVTSPEWRHETAPTADARAARPGCPNPGRHFPRGVWAAVLQDLSERKGVSSDTLKKRLRRAAMAARGEPLT